MTASTDAVDSSNGETPPAARRRAPLLLTTAVLMLIYQQVPPPFGVTAIQVWLHYAIWALGTLLLAQYVHDNARTARILGHRLTAKLRLLKAGFQVSYAPGQDQTGPPRGQDIGHDHRL